MCPCPSPPCSTHSATALLYHTPNQGWCDDAPKRNAVTLFRMLFLFRPLPNGYLNILCEYCCVYSYIHQHMSFVFSCFVVSYVHVGVHPVNGMGKADAGVGPRCDSRGHGTADHFRGEGGHYHHSQQVRVVSCHHSRFLQFFRSFLVHVKNFFAFSHRTSQGRGVRRIGRVRYGRG